MNDSSESKRCSFALGSNRQIKLPWCRSFLFVDGTFRWGTAFVEGRRGRELVFEFKVKVIKD